MSPPMRVDASIPMGPCSGATAPSGPCRRGLLKVSFRQGGDELFEMCSRNIKYGRFERAASSPTLGIGRTFNYLQKNKYRLLDIILPSIGHGRRGII